MRLRKEEIASFKPMFNYVLVKSIKDMNKILVAGQEMFIDISYKPEDHAEILCEVVATPARLIFDRKKPLVTAQNVQVSMEWETDMELKQGDIIWCNYLATIRSSKVYCDEQVYFLIPYDRVYMKKVGKELQMLNGYILIEPEEEDILGTQTSLISPKKAPTVYATVVLTGRPVKSYYDELKFEDPIIQPGQRVRMKTKNYVYIEAPLHQTLPRRFAVTRRTRIMGICDYVEPHVEFPVNVEM